MVASRVDLPSGGWADIRDADAIKAKDRKKVLLALDDETGAMAAQLQASEMILALAVEKWSFDLPLPIDDLSSLGELSIPDYDAVSEAARPIYGLLFPDFTREAANPQ